jgi:hypothetical protein
MSVFHENMLLGAQQQVDYQISRSLRFNSADSAYLSRTPASAGNRKTWTWSGWLKRGALSATEAESTLFSGGGGANDSTIVFTGNQLFYYYYASPGGYLADVRSIAVFRDLSAWYHIVVAVDTTQATASNRVRLYVNGSEVSYSSPTYPSLSLDMGINTVSTVHTVGVRNTLFNYLSGYLADIHFIDGQALTPSSFTEVSATTGQLIPKAYTGSFGTNGFHLDFADNSAATAAALGKDTSGNGNNWTPNNLSVTAGAGNDSLVDVPTNGAQTDTGVGGEVRGNYATLNPLDANLATVADLKNGNLEIIPGAAYTGYAQGSNSTIGIATGKWYFEGSPVLSSGSGNQSSFGWTQSTSPGGTFLNNDKASCIGVSCDNYGNIASFKTASVSASLANNTNLGIGAVSGDVFQLSIDFDAGKFWVGKNGTWYSSGNPGAGTNATATFTNSGLTWRVWVETTAYSDNWNKAVVNFGQRPFAYTAPSGFKALNTANLPAPVVTKPSTVMDVVLYTGTGATLTPTSSLGFSPDLVWIKGRSGATDHALYDTVRGAQARLESNTTDAEVTTDGGVTAFNSNGFTLGTLAQVNTNTATYAAWCWDAGTSNVVNTQGSITSTVRANPSAGFSVVTYTGNGTTGATVGHGLGVAPRFIIVKDRDTALNWFVLHNSDSLRQFEGLNTTAASTTAAAFNTTAPSSTVFTLSSGSGVNSNTKNHVAYCFAPVAGYSSFGSYTGNGSADGPFVYTGFRPRWVMIKNSSAVGNWILHDSSRPGYNLTNTPFYPNLTNAESPDPDRNLDILSNGFKIRTAGSADINGNTNTILYCAFAENPFTISRAR